MYEHQTITAIRDRMLARVSNNVDKREGGVIYDAVAPDAAEFSQVYATLDEILELAFADTASGEFLIRRIAEFGVQRKGATPARRKGLFFGVGNTAFDVPLNGRYAISGTAYRVDKRITIGEYELVCETAGIAGNQNFGNLLPLDYVNGLARAELQDVLVPGQDAEDEEVLRDRFFRTVNEPAFGGNVADYRQRISAIDGVGACKVYPVWAGGGTVKATLIASDWSVPTPTLIDTVQTLADPTTNSGEGLGFAPIGHHVTIAGVTALTINVETTLTLASGVTVGQVQSDIEAVIDDYLTGLRQDWATTQPSLIVRVAQIDARMLAVQGVEDVADTTLNGSSANLTLAADEIPELGTVTIDE